MKELIYLSSLAREHGQHLRAYLATMMEFDEYLAQEYCFRLEDIKGKPLPAWIEHLLRKLNPTDFEINTLQEEHQFEAWLAWMSGVKKQIASLSVSK